MMQGEHEEAVAVSELLDDVAVIENNNSSSIINTHDSENGSREPLLEQQHQGGTYDKTTNNGARKGQPWMVYFCTAVAVCGSYELGFWLSYSSPTQSAVTKELSLTTAQYAVFASILSVGAMIGAITSGLIADVVGRIWAMRLVCIICAAGWLPIYFAQDALALDIGRFIGGYGMGAFSYVVPVYIAEIAPVNLRGAVAASHQLLTCTGIGGCFVLGLVLTWRSLALLGIIPCVILLFGLFFTPESPRWLVHEFFSNTVHVDRILFKKYPTQVRRGDLKEFRGALQTLRGKDTDISIEAAEIQEHLDEIERLPKAGLLDLFQKRYRRSLTAGAGLMVCRQFCGISGICSYNTEIFELAGVSAAVGSTSYVIVQMLFTLVGAILVDNAGRKPLALISAAGLGIGSFVAASGFFLKDHDLVEAVPAIVFLGIMVYTAAFSVGMGPIPWVTMAEIFPINVKGTAGSLATMVNWFSSWIVSYTFIFFLDWSSYGTFLIFGAFNVAAIVFVVMAVPETKRRTLEQIHTAINN